MAGFSKLGNMAKAKQCVDFFWRVGRTAIATVLKTVDRKVLGVRIPHSPPFSSSEGSVEQQLVYMPVTHTIRVRLSAEPPF
jgi:hypothetical protein